MQTESIPTILRIRVLEGEGSIHTAGTRSTQPVVISVTDETGKPVEGASVSVRLPEDGPTGVFPNGMHTEIVMTGLDGRVAIRSIQWARSAGPVQIRITASKGEVRAGILSAQYITEPAGANPRRNPDVPASPTTEPRPANRPVSTVEPPSRSKWILLAALIGGAAAGGVAAAAHGGKSGASGAVNPPGVTQPGVTIGNPSISVGQP